VSQDHQLTIRLPDTSVRLLSRLSSDLDEPRWLIVHKAIQAYARRVKVDQDL